MKNYIALFLTLFGLFTKVNAAEKIIPKYLYKVISVEDWKLSQAGDYVVLPVSDSDFIHFATEDQLQGVVDKYWSDAPKYVVLKVDPEKLPGRLVYETNPGGSNRYFHLYNGTIPLKAVAESRVVKTNV